MKLPKPVILSAQVGIGLALLILQNTQWFAVQLSRGTAVSVPGSDVAPAVTAIAFVLIALAGALSIARGRIRLVLSVLGVVASVWLLLSIGAIVLRGSGVLDAVGKITGISGDALSAEISSVDASASGFIALALSAACIVVSVLSVSAQRQWKTVARRYDVETTTQAAEEPDAATDWDSLSRGEDPTESR